MSQHLESMKAEIEELLNRGQEVKEKAEDYLEEAISIDEDYKNRHQDRNYIPLDDLPYGEEILRTEGLPGEVGEIIDALEDIDFDKQTVTTVVEIIEEARRVIENADATVDDCTSLPPREEEPQL
jgi:hypothetical protein